MTQKLILLRESDFFERNKGRFIKDHKGKFVLIKKDSTIGFFSTEEEAYKEGLNKFGNKPFFIKQIEDKDKNESIASFVFA